MSSSSGAVSGSAPPTACAIRPQFGSPPFSAALTSGEFATPRAARSTSTRVAAAHDHAADPRRALAVAHDLERELAQEGVEGLAEAQLVLGLLLDRHAACAARHQQRRVVRGELAVDRDAVERALDGHAEQQVGGRGVERGVGLHEAEHRRERRLDHARALGLRAEADCAAARELDVERRALLERVGGHDRRGEVGVAVGPQPARGAGEAGDDRLRVERDADDAGRGDRDLLVRHAGRDRRGALHLRRVVEAAPAGRGVRVARVRRDRAQRVELGALLRHDDRRGEDARAREARRARGAALVADEQPDVRVAGLLQAGGDPGGAEALRQPARRGFGHAVGHLDPARAEERGRRGAHASRPAVSS